MSQTSTQRIRPLPAQRPGPSFHYAARAAGLRQSAIREILKVPSTPDSISFAGGLPAPELFPVADFRRAADAMLGKAGPASLQYDLTEGHLPLRAWICGHLLRTAGIEASPEEVLVMNGSQQGLDLVAKVLLDPGDVVLVENPAYLGALQAFRAYEARPVGLPADDDPRIVIEETVAMARGDRVPDAPRPECDLPGQRPPGHPPPTPPSAARAQSRAGCEQTPVVVTTMFWRITSEGSLPSLP